jgi:Fe-S-cluster containining protein
MHAIRNAGQGGEDCFVLVPNSPGFVEQLGFLMPDRDIEAAFPEHGSHWRLATTAQGACIFLGPAGCVLDREVRPTYCRLFPLWQYRGQLTWFAAAECLANEECPSLAGMLAAMGTSGKEVRTLFREMCEKLGLQTDDKVNS